MKVQVTVVVTPDGHHSRVELQFVDSDVHKARGEHEPGCARWR